MQTLQPPVQRPGAARLFLIFASIGLQSFGGGASTTLLIQREFVNKHGWLTMDDYTHLWNLCLFAPGINLIGLTILIGNRLGGWLGVICSLLGLLVPSAAITCLLAAGFKKYEHTHALQAVLQGVIPATAGIMLMVGINFAQPNLRRAAKAGPTNLLICLLLIGACAIAITLQVQVFVVLIGTALCGIIFFTRPLILRRQHQPEREEEGRQDD
jgi:chromate transporter